jgi:ribosomal protein L37AE/L43A
MRMRQRLVMRQKLSCPRCKREMDDRAIRLGMKICTACAESTTKKQRNSSEVASTESAPDDDSVLEYLRKVTGHTRSK